VLLQEGGHETQALPWGDPKEGTKDAWKSAGLGTNCQPNGTSGTLMSTHLLEFLSPQTTNIFPSCSRPHPRTQVREDRVVRGLRPCSELVTMPRKVESEAEFAPVLGAGRLTQVMYWETTRGRIP